MSNSNSLQALKSFRLASLQRTASVSDPELQQKRKERSKLSTENFSKQLLLYKGLVPPGLKKATFYEFLQISECSCVGTNL